MTDSLRDLFGPDTVIYSYTRAQAIADGVLVDLTVGNFAEPWRASPFYPCHVACTDTVFAQFVDADDPCARLRVLLLTLAWAIADLSTGARDTSEVVFEFKLWNGPAPKDFRIKAVTHSGDLGERCLTIMLPHED